MKQLTTLISALFFLTLGVSNAWALPACPSSGYFHNCYGTYDWDNGDEYLGDWQNDKRHGQGTYTYGPNSEWAGDQYVGEYKNGKRHGQGTYTHANGDKYVGGHKDNKRHGQGTFTYGPNSEWQEINT